MAGMNKEEIKLFYRRFSELYQKLYDTYKDADLDSGFTLFRKFIENFCNITFEEQKNIGINEDLFKNDETSVFFKINILKEKQIIPELLAEQLDYIFTRGNEGSHDGEETYKRSLTICLFLLMVIKDWHLGEYRKSKKLRIAAEPEIEKYINEIEGISQKIINISKNSRKIEASDFNKVHPVDDPDIGHYQYIFNQYIEAHDCFILKDFQSIYPFIESIIKEIFFHILKDEEKECDSSLENQLNELNDSNLIPKRKDRTNNRTYNSVVYDSLLYIIRHGKKGESEPDAATILLMFTFAIDWYLNEYRENEIPATSLGGFSDEKNRLIRKVCGKINKLNKAVKKSFEPNREDPENGGETTDYPESWWKRVVTYVKNKGHMAKRIVLMALILILIWLIIRECVPSPPPPDISKNLSVIVVEGPIFKNPAPGEPKVDPRSWRENWAQLITMLSEAGAKVIVFDIELVGESADDDALIKAIEEAKANSTYVVFVNHLGNALTDDFNNDQCSFGFACQLQTQPDGSNLLPLLLMRTSGSEVLSRHESLVYTGVKKYFSLTKKGCLAFEQNKSESGKVSGGTLTIEPEDEDADMDNLPSILLGSYVQGNAFHCDYIKKGDVIHALPIDHSAIDILRSDAEKYFYYSRENEIYNDAYDEHPESKKRIALFYDDIVVVGVLDENDKTEDGKYYGVELMAAGVNTLLSYVK